MHAYHQILAILMQLVIAATFVTRIYALYDKSRLVLFGLTAIVIAGGGAGGFLISERGQHLVSPQLPPESTGCSTGLSWSQSWRLAVIWCCVMVFDFIVVALTLFKTIQIKLVSGGTHTLTELLTRDGAMYFGAISLASLANVLTFFYGSEITRGVATTITNTLSCTLVSRLMFNLRKPREYTIQVTQQSPIVLRIRRRYFSTQA